MKTKPNKTDSLLLRAFVRGGMIHEGTLDCDDGSRAQWSYLHSEGIVSFTYSHGRGLLGHAFSGKLTAKGISYIMDELTD